MSNLPDVLPEDDQLISSRGAVTNAKLEAMLRKVRALLVQAEDPGATPAEAQTFRNKAEALMLRYRIDETQLIDAPEAGIIPLWNKIVIHECGGPHGGSAEYAQFYKGMARDIVEHVGCRGEITTKWEGDARVTTLHYVGFPSDLRIVDMLYTSAQVAFNTRLEPKYDPNLSEQENAYNMRKAGMEGWRIAVAIWGKRGSSLCCCQKKNTYYVCRVCTEAGDAKHHAECMAMETTDSNLYKARKLFKKEALARGEDPSELLGQGNSMSTYRESYANGFYWELRSRLRDMRRSRGEGSVGIELGGRKEKIDMAFYKEYPQYAPAKAAIGAVRNDEGDLETEDEDTVLRCPWCEEEVEAGQDPCPHCDLPIDWASNLDRGHARGTYVDPRANCERCQKAKSGYCREHSYLRPTSGRYYERAHSSAGERAGRRAAQSVDLGGRPTGRLNS